MGMFTRSQPEKRREIVGGCLFLGAIFAYASYSVARHQPQWPLKAAALGGVALLLWGVSLYHASKGLASPRTTDGPLTEAQRRSVLLRWPMTLGALFLTGGCVDALCIGRPVDAAMCGFVCLVMWAGAVEGWRLWQGRRDG